MYQSRDQNLSYPVSMKNQVKTVTREYGRIDASWIREMYEEKMKEEILSRYNFPTKPSSDGFYHIYVKDAAKGRRQFKASTLEILKTKVYEFVKEQEGLKSHTFKSCYEAAKALRTKRTKKNNKRYSLENTINRMDSDYKRFFEGTEFELKEIGEITKEDVEEFIEDALTRFDLRKKGFNNLKSLLKKTFDYAFKEYYTAENVYERCDLSQFADLIMDDVPITKRVHSAKEVEDILGYIHLYQAEHPDYIPSYALELQILIGARRGEIPPLTWDDISDDSIFIHRELVTLHKREGRDTDLHAIVEHTKNHSNRMFPMTEELKEFFDRLRDVHRMYYKDSSFLFPGGAITGTMTNNVVYKFYRKCCDKVGIKHTPGVVIGTHSFRRNAITRTVNKSGGNIYMASKLYGNSPRVAEANYYTGVDLDAARRLLES